MSKEKPISLFSSKPDHEMYAHMEYGESFSYWIEGYKNAINAQFYSISQHSADRFYIDSAILPLMFSIHQFLELSMKSLYWESSKTIDERGYNPLKINSNQEQGKSFHMHELGHSLPDLLESLKGKLKEIDQEWFGNLSIDQLNLFIGEVKNITPNGFAWRYPHPETKKVIFKEVRFPRTLDYITIETIWEGIQEELKGVELLATDRPHNKDYTNRGRNYWTEEEIAQSEQFQGSLKSKNNSEN